MAQCKIPGCKNINYIGSNLCEEHYFLLFPEEDANHKTDKEKKPHESNSGYTKKH